MTMPDFMTQTRDTCKKSFTGTVTGTLAFW